MSLNLQNKHTYVQISKTPSFWSQAKRIQKWKYLQNNEISNSYVVQKINGAKNNWITVLLNLISEFN